MQTCLTGGGGARQALHALAASGLGPTGALVALAALSAGALVAGGPKRRMAAGATNSDELLRLFASYSPAEVVLAAAANPRPPSAPEQQDFDAAIGFVDVSGFTALSEKLNKDHGRKGAELLNQCAACPLPATPPPGAAALPPRALASRRVRAPPVRAHGPIRQATSCHIKSRQVLSRQI